MQITLDLEKEEAEMLKFLVEKRMEGARRAQYDRDVSEHNKEKAQEEHSWLYDLFVKIRAATDAAWPT